MLFIFGGEAAITFPKVFPIKFIPVDVFCFDARTYATPAPAVVFVVPLGVTDRLVLYVASISWSAVSLNLEFDRWINEVAFYEVVGLLLKFLSNTCYALEVYYLDDSPWAEDSCEVVKDPPNEGNNCCYRWSNAHLSGDIFYCDLWECWF